MELLVFHTGMLYAKICTVGIPVRIINSFKKQRFSTARKLVIFFGSVAS
jgi:hypothetical protein